MTKPITKDGKAFRIRRGKLVEIPSEWVGKVTSRQTINKRASKQPPLPPEKYQTKDYKAYIDDQSQRNFKNKTDKSNE